MNYQATTDKPSSDSMLTASRTTRSNRLSVWKQIAFGILGSFSRVPFLQERDEGAKIKAESEPGPYAPVSCSIPSPACWFGAIIKMDGAITIWHLPETLWAIECDDSIVLDLINSFQNDTTSRLEGIASGSRVLRAGAAPSSISGRTTKRGSRRA